LCRPSLADNKDEWGELWQPDTLCLMMNEGMRSWGHQFVYDAEELVRILVEAGFNSISFQDYRKSQDKVLCGLESRPFHNELIIEARKTENPFQSIEFNAIKHNEDQWPVKLKNDLVASYKTNIQSIADQARHIHNLEITLMKYQNSVYGKCLSVMSRLYSFMKSK
jgi:ribosomal protein L11 methylase PrmA